MKRLLHNDLLVFTLLSVVGIGFKSLFLVDSGLWHDEAFNIYFSQQHWGHLKHISEWNCNPPLYYYFLWVWEHVFGTGEYAIRFSSAIFSALSGGIVYLFCARNLSRISGWIAFLFFTISNQMFFFSHDVRPHALVVFLVLLSSFLFLELLRKPGWKNTVILAIVNFGIVYLSYVAAVAVLLQACMLLFYKDRSFRKFFGIAFGITVLLAALRFTPKTLILLFSAVPFAPTAEFSQLSGSIYGFFNGPDLFYVFLFIAIVIVWQLRKNMDWKTIFGEQRPALVYVWMMGFGATVVCFLLGYVSSVFVTDMVVFAAPFIYISLAWFPERANDTIRYPLTTLLIVFILFSALRIDIRTPKPMDYRGAVHLVKNLQANNTPVLVETRDMEALFSYYYDRSAFTDYGNVQEHLKEKRIYLVNTAKEVGDADVIKSERLVLVQTYEQFNLANASLEKYLADNFSRKESTRFYKGVTISVYSK